MNKINAKQIGARGSILEVLKETPAIIFLAAFFILSMILVPKFSNPENLFNIVIQSTDLIILACGMTFVFLNGSIDFSMTAILALASVLGAKVMVLGDSPVYIFLAVLVMLGVGLGIGALNGLCITRFKMPSFIATMATQLIFSGVALTITQSNSIGGIPSAFNQVSQGSLGVVPYPVIITIAVVALTVFLLYKTIYGRRMIAVGTNQKTAYVSGISVKKTIFTIFIISGVLAALASVVMTARLGAGLPALGKDMLMDIVAAVVVGGTSMFGGKANLGGTVIAALLVVTLNNSLNLLAVDWYLINVCKGALILVVALYSAVSFREK